MKWRRLLWATAAGAGALVYSGVVGEHDWLRFFFGVGFGMVTTELLYTWIMRKGTQ